ncbi:MAG: leucine--tRNA ligase [Acidimicrobiia bacterium]|nr:leucine--tRNA ligase [Acidimicrobiia bacterium]
MAAYDHEAIERHWQERWETDGLYRSTVDWEKPKHYALTMLPYPSGDLHMGHWYAMTPSDARARVMRMKGYNVLFPMGFDAFGLPAENAAVQRNVHPAKWTYENIDRMRRQLRSMGAMFDWEREAVSCEPAYYRWTEWFFKRMFERGIAYRGEAMVNWSPTLQTVLANEQVIDGRDERNGQPVVQKLMEQWFFAITKYADELLSFEGIDWPDAIKAMQSNWIGRSEGAEVTFRTEVGDEIVVFTTRPDTLWGATFMVLAPEHPLVDSITSPDRREVIDAYRIAAAARSELERMEDTKEKSGVFTGGYAVNPVNRERIPVWIADYVLLSYGTGAIMAVPAHDQRDFEFARQFELPIIPVIRPQGAAPLVEPEMEVAYIGPGEMVNSGPIDGIETTNAKGRANPSIAATIDWLEEAGLGREAINYRLRDWLISRQRYWGSPIPMLHRDDGEVEPVADEDLPVVLPEDVEFEGRSPLVTNEEFLAAVDSEGVPARRETDTMDTFMCSSWYWLRYLSPSFEQAPFDPDEAAYWLPVDVYTGGAEHAVMHLLYARFFVKAMRDMGVFDDTERVMREHGRDPSGLFDEPFAVLRNQGQILGEERPGDRLVVDGHRRDELVVASSIRVDPTAGPEAGLVVGELIRRTENALQVQTEEGLVAVKVPEEATIEIPTIFGTNDVTQLKHHLDVERMSKSKGNTINPDELVAIYGADTVRTHLMFAFEWQKGGPWDSRGIVGSWRFIDDVWKLGTSGYQPGTVSEEASSTLRRRVHQSIAKVDADMMDFKWNTAVATLMTLRNEMQDALRSADVSPDVWAEARDTMLKLLAPIAPHITEELWQATGHATSIHLEPWPESDAHIAREDTVTMVVQVNGKVRDRIEVDAGISAEDAEATALAAEKIAPWTEGKTIRKVIARPPKLVNIVVG